VSGLGILLFVVAILVVVMVHESGHFFVAKLFDFKATKFFVGFGPTVWSTHKGETEYGIRALPLGGYVKIVGMNPYEEVPPQDRPRAYPNKPKWQRALLLVAGSATHFVVAFVLLWIAVMTFGFPTGPLTNQVSSIDARIDGERTGAVEAGLRPDDRIVAVGGRTTTEWKDIRSYIRSHGNETARFTIVRDGATETVELRLGQAVFNRDDEVVDYVPPGEELPALEPGQTSAGFLGVEPTPEYETEDLLGGPVAAAGATWDITVESVKFIDDIFTMPFDEEFRAALSGEEERRPDGGVGLVGGARLAGESVERGEWFRFILMIVGFTVVVGIMNLLPLPPLDGGHLAVVAWEAITGRAVDIRKLIPVAAVVISFFLMMFFAMLYLDLFQPIHLPN
jgi:membrane-associated protease RseP (regulator of RpoE activity)